MTLSDMDSAVQALLGGIEAITDEVADRIYVSPEPEDAVVPNLVMNSFGKGSGRTLQGRDGIATAQLVFDIHASSRSEATRIAEALEHSIDGYLGVQGDVRIQEIELEHIEAGPEWVPDKGYWEYTRLFSIDWSEEV